MSDHQEFLAHYGHALLFAAVFVAELGLPIPSVPLLVAAGALAASGRLDPLLTLALPTAAALAANLIWYELGRRKGIRVLQLLCRIALEPDSCVRQTESTFARHGARSLLVAKFVPGLNTVAPPLAGIFRMRLRRFVLFDGLGAVLWVGAFVAAGYFFSDELAWVGDEGSRLWKQLLVSVVGALTLWIAWKFARRRRFVRQLRIDRITPEELKHKIDAGENLVIVDLRGSLDFEAEPGTIPGARRIAAGSLDGIREELVRAPEVILYCS
jgi:membrane protein DedA with SNARE-associated domain